MHISDEKYDKIHVKNIAESIPETFRGDLSLSLSHSKISKSTHFFEKYGKIHVKKVLKSLPEAFRGDLSLSLSLFEHGFSWKIMQ